eukprot:m.34690 g.34690  ORF g.34690 m.34690 type:complete len:517 (+) comp5177_c0_seq1:202-1752(+)
MSSRLTVSAMRRLGWPNGGACRRHPFLGTAACPDSMHTTPARTASDSSGSHRGSERKDHGDTTRPVPIIDVLQDSQKEWKKGMAAGGGLAVLGGLSWLGWQYVPMGSVLDTVAAASAVGGLCAMAAAYPHKDGKSGKDAAQTVVSMRGYLSQTARGVPRLSFTRLNSRGRAPTKALRRIAAGGQEIPESLSSKLAKADDLAEEQRRTAVADRTAEIESLMEDMLERGATGDEVRHRCFPRCYVVSFEDPPRSRSRRGQPAPSTASAVAHFSGVVSLLVDVAKEYDEVVVKLTSPGGAVAEYGQLAMQLLRLRKAGITTTVCIDTMAASGGYMAACVADRVYASPFAFVGSIGVVTEMPNVSRLLQKNNVDWMLFTAGKYKRTVHPFTEVTEEGKEKLQEQLEDIHTAFRDHVASHRDEANADDVSTGEAWLALQALQKGLVDELMTSDEYVQSKMMDSIVIEVRDVPPQPNFRDLFERTVSAGEGVLESIHGLIRGTATDASPMSMTSHTHERFRL